MTDRQIHPKSPSRAWKTAGFLVLVLFILLFAGTAVARIVSN